MIPRSALLSAILLGSALAILAPTCMAADKKAEYGPKGNFLRQPYLQMATSDSIHILWRSPGKIAAEVRYGSAPDNLDQVVSGSSIIARRTKGDGGSLPYTDATGKTVTPLDLHSAPKGTVQYNAGITGLKPDTKYFYAIHDGEKRLTEESSSFYFRTHPVPGTERDAYIWVVGDSGTGAKRPLEVHDAMVAYNKKNNLELDMYLHVGDMAYTRGQDHEFQGGFFNQYAPTLRNTVCWAAMGNHEGYTSKGISGVGPYYDAYVCPTKAEAGGVASGKEAYYSFDYGKVHFIVLDSHDLDRRPTGAMAQWLQADLEKTNAEWLVAYFHHPPYTKGSHDSDKEAQLIEMREHIMPILESGGIDLVLTGHSHIYERSMLIDGAYDTPTTAENKVLDDGDGDPAGDGPYKKSPGLNPNQGVIQIVTGHGGQGLKRRGLSPVFRKVVVEHGSTLIKVSGSTMDVIMLNYQGEERDKFRISKKETVNLARIAKPWRDEAYLATLKGKKDPKDKGKNATMANLPAKFEAVIPRNAKWSYLAGSHAAPGWTKAGFDSTGWKTGEAGFGYGDNDDRTEINMEDKFTTVYIRREFTLSSKEDLDKLGLAICYDDGFIAYINGHEVTRQCVSKGSGADVKGVSKHEANAQVEYYSLKSFAEHFKVGTNIIAIEGHNENKKSSDFTLDPFLIKTK